MTDLLASHGVPLLALITFLSCLALPIPASLAMIAAGALAAHGALPLGPVLAAALAGALAGDQLGFHIGRGAAPGLHRALLRTPRTARLLDRAERLTDRHGGPGIFFSRWLAAPLGPYVNLLSGTAGLGWGRFTLWAAPGKALWVGAYVGLGHALAHDLDPAIALAGQVGLAGLALPALLVLGLVLRARRRAVT